MSESLSPTRGAASPVPSYLDRPVYSASARFPGGSLFDAVALCHNPSFEAFGQVRTRHMQLCPQHRYHLDDVLADELMAEFPDTNFRLHASVRVQKPHTIIDASSPDSPVTRDYFQRVAFLSHRFDAKVYSLHAGYRQSCDLETMAKRVRSLQDSMGLSVAVEGLYPNPRRAQLLDSWREYAWLLESGLSFALDMSHLQIIAACERKIERSLVRELLSSPACVEVHLSDNDGTRDTHQAILETAHLWWWPELVYAHSDAVFFTEGNAGRYQTVH